MTLLRVCASFVGLLLPLMACHMNDPLPRNMPLTAFDPHRNTFECKREEDVVPPIDPQAEAWLQEGLRLTSWDLWPDQRDFPQAVRLWEQAAARNHWKAMMNLAGTLATGDGVGAFAVDADPERAVQIIERGMTLSIPAAFDAMGTYHQRAMGVRGNSDRAFAFWQLAADMGSADAQAHLGKMLDADHDDPPERLWNNRSIGLKMLECAVSQGNGKAASTLSLSLGLVENDYVRALTLLQDGARWGCEDCANALSVEYRKGSAWVAGIKDVARAERYGLLGDALWANRDLRFPNLEKILPLPPAPLPYWNGDKKTLIDAAKGVVPLPPKPPASAASQRTGRAHIPDGHSLPDDPGVQTAPAYESTRVGLAGYWLPQLLHPCTDRHAAWNDAQVALRYEAHERFDPARDGLVDEDGRIVFHYLGVPVLAPPAVPRVDASALRGITRAVPMPAPFVAHRGDVVAPVSGVWLARLPGNDTRAAQFNHWRRQRYVLAGATFPGFIDAPPVDAQDLAWYCCGQANEERLGGWSAVRVEPAPG